MVLSSDGRLGRVVFEVPVLLPDEQFVPVELLGRGPLFSRNGSNRSSSRGGDSSRVDNSRVNSSRDGGGRLKMPRSGRRPAP